jgi:hypothetical protein
MLYDASRSDTAAYGSDSACLPAATASSLGTSSALPGTATDNAASPNSVSVARASSSTIRVPPVSTHSVRQQSAAPAISASAAHAVNSAAFSIRQYDAAPCCVVCFAANSVSDITPCVWCKYSLWVLFTFELQLITAFAKMEAAVKKKNNFKGCRICLIILSFLVPKTNDSFVWAGNLRIQVLMDHLFILKLTYTF